MMRALFEEAQQVAAVVMPRGISHERVAITRTGELDAEDL
jgi:hypothetical protein